MNPTVIMQTINEEFVRCRCVDTVRSINAGNCYHWAYIAHRLIGGQIYYNEYHACLKLKGRYYDAERLDGVDDPEELRTFSFWGVDNLRRAQTISQFRSFWKRNGTYGWKADLCRDILAEIRTNRILGIKNQ